MLKKNLGGIIRRPGFGIAGDDVWVDASAMIGMTVFSGLW